MSGRGASSETRGPATPAAGLFGRSWEQDANGLRVRAWRSEVPDRDDFVERGAIYDVSERYRYLLWRRWSAGEQILWLLLNPSTATEREGGLDATLWRCARFSRDWGFGGMNVANIFALRSTRPQVLYEVEDPVGAENDSAIIEAACESSEIVAGWGAHGRLRGRADEVVRLLEARDLMCLARTQGGEPGHPLYLRGSATREFFRRGHRGGGDT